MEDETKRTLWVLTESYNDYDQHGSYFVAAWTHKPEIHEIMKAAECPEPEAIHIYSGGGRINSEYSWFNLREVEEGESWDRT